MSKRQHIAPYVVEVQRDDGTWFPVCYEMNERLARRAVREHEEGKRTLYWIARYRPNPMYESKEK